MDYKRTLLVLVALVMGLAVRADAGSVVGTIGFNIQGSVTTNAADLSPSITFTNVRTNNTGSQDWTGFTSTYVAGGMLAIDELTVDQYNSTGSGLEFANGDFGSFSGVVTSDVMQTTSVGFLSSGTRLVKATGIFSPGDKLIQKGYNVNVLAQISIFFQGFTGSMSSLPGGRSGTVVMSTQPIPEPGTIVILALGSAACYGMMRRRKSASGSDAGPKAA